MQLHIYQDMTVQSESPGKEIIDGRSSHNVYGTSGGAVEI